MVVSTRAASQARLWENKSQFTGVEWDAGWLGDGKRQQTPASLRDSGGALLCQFLELADRALDSGFEFPLIKVAADAQHQHLAIAAHLRDAAAQLRHG
jgi:hypothetical protein